MPLQQLPLTQGYTALVDAADYVWLTQWKWRYNSGYATTTIYENGQPNLVYLHRLLLNPPPGLQVDHIDHNPLNCTRANLRLATPAQNQHNKGLQANNTSGYKGVSRCRDQWQARIRYNGQRIYLGQYSSAELAARVYDAMARCLFGAYAHLNFPDDEPTAPILAMPDGYLQKPER